MKKFALLSLFALLFVTTLASAQCRIELCAFYGGDLNVNSPNAGGLANENDALIGGDPYGAATYQNFTAGRGWTVDGLFTNNLSQLAPSTGYWEIRSGVSEGNGGTLVASGTGSMTQTLTGRSAFGFNEVTDEVDGLNISLAEGTMYWMAVVPNDPNNNGRSFNSNSTDGINAIGTQTSNLQFWNSAIWGTDFTNANNEGPYPAFSSGVVLYFIPEASSMILLGSGLVAVAGFARRCLMK